MVKKRNKKQRDVLRTNKVFHLNKISSRNYNQKHHKL